MTTGMYVLLGLAILVALAVGAFFYLKKKDPEKLEEILQAGRDFDDKVHDRFKPREPSSPPSTGNVPPDYVVKPGPAPNGAPAPTTPYPSQRSNTMSTFDPFKMIDGGAQPWQVRDAWEAAGSPKQVVKDGVTYDVVSGVGIPIVNDKQYSGGGVDGGSNPAQPTLSDKGAIALNAVATYKGSAPVTVTFTGPASGKVELAVAPKAPQADQVIASVNGAIVQTGGGNYVSVQGIQVKAGPNTLTLQHATSKGEPMDGSSSVQVNG